MKRLRTRFGAALATMTLGATALVAMGGTAHAVGSPPIPQLTFDHIISSHPFSGAPGSASDIEGLGYVPADGSMWVADDNADRIWEIDPTSGSYKSQLRGGNSDPATGGKSANTDFHDATNVTTPGLKCGDNAPTGYFAADGTTPIDTAALECLSRTDDFESAVFDPGPTAASSDDVLYVTSGNCCSSGLPTVYRYVDNDNDPVTPPVLQPTVYPYHPNPTVWKLTRDGSGHFKPTSWQALLDGTDPTAAGLQPGGGLWFGHSTNIQTYNFDSNTLGPNKSLSGISTDIVGISFPDANTAFITTATPNTSSGRTTATSDSTIHRFDISGSTWTENLAWQFPLASIGTPGGTTLDDGMIDARDLAVVSSGLVDKFYVSDGYDGRSGGDHPIYVYTLGSAPAPTAAFTAIPNTGRAPYTVQFTDTSTPVAPAKGAPSSWLWDFGDPASGVNNTSTLQNPTHQYSTPGNFTAKLTATNAAGSTIATNPITVKAQSNLPGGYILDGFGGVQRFRVGTGPNPPAATEGPYWNGWDIARGLAVASDGQNGFVLDGFGGLHTVRLGGGPLPATVHGGPYWNGWDIARGVALLPNNTGGYVVDAYGGIHPFSLGSNPMPPDIIGAPYWNGQDMARGITIMPNGTGGYINDRTGKLWGFKVGNSGTVPATPNSVSIITATSVQGVSVMFDGSGGFTVDGWGGPHGFGVGASGPPSAFGGPYWPGWDIAHDVALMPDV